MAQGTLALFEEFSLRIADATHELDAGVFKVALITEQVGVTATIAASDAAPAYAAYTEVTGTGYTAGGATLATVTWTEAGGTATFAVTGGATVWNQNGAGPATIKTALIYDDTTAGKQAIAFMDMTTDGVTAISLIDGDITITWNPTIFTLA